MSERTVLRIGSQALFANSLRVHNSDARDGSGRSNTSTEDQLEEEFIEFWDRYKEFPLCGRNVIVKSLCPQIYGMCVVFIYR